MEKIKLPKINLKSIWMGIEFSLVCLLVLLLFIGCIIITANGYNEDHGEYPKQIKLGLGGNIKSSLVVTGSHEYIVTTYTTKTGAGISTIHNQSCKFCVSKKSKK
jgi:hypothetical protein